MTPSRNSRRSFVLSFLALLLLAGCVDRFTPEISGFERVLVIDGILSNDQQKQVVKLSRSSEGINQNLLEETGAEVSIVDDQGQTFEFEEEDPGIYVSIENGFAKEGRSYQLVVRTIDGKTYESKAQRMPKSQPIRKVYAEIENQYFFDDQADIPGYRFYVDGPETLEEESYLMWLESATYKYQADYPIDFTWAGRLEVFPNRDSLTTCYKDISIRSVSTFSSQQLSGNGAKAIRLNFERADRLPLSIRYSLLVKQYNISREAYIFWNGIEKQLSSDADLYTTQPYEIRGNMRSMSNEDEAVLGYFTVGAISEKRIFVNAPNVNIPDTAPCTYDYMAYGYRFVYGPPSWPLYVAEGPEGLALLGTGCLDCRELGGVLSPPEFWEE